jgi:hypothetical protein
MPQGKYTFLVMEWRLAAFNKPTGVSCRCIHQIRHYYTPYIRCVYTITRIWQNATNVKNRSGFQPSLNVISREKHLVGR